MTVAEMTQKIIETRVKEVPNKERVLEFIGTTEIPDRDGEIIKAEAWQVDRYTKNPVVQWAHQYDKPPIGRTLSIRQNKKKETIFEIEFASKETYEFADTIYKLCKDGYLNATSVGFIPIEFEKGKKESDASRIFTKVELLEISVVPVPSNPEALVTARNAGVITVKEFEALTKNEVKKEAKEVSQAEIKDEIDYLNTIITQVGLSDENKTLFNALHKRLSGDDTPVDIKKSAIRSVVEPVIKMMNEHHEAHEKFYKGCHEALKAMCEMPDGDTPMMMSVDDYVQKKIKELMEVK